MVKDRRSGARNVARSVFAFFWIVLGGLSTVYLFTLLANPGALGGQIARADSQPGEAPISGDQGSSGLGTAEMSEIKSTLRQLSQQMAEINTRLKPLEKAAGSFDTLSDNSSPSTSTPQPVTPPEQVASQAKKPDIPLAQPAEKPAPLPMDQAKKPDLASAQPAEKPTQAAKPAEAPKHAEASKPTQVAALEPKPAEKPAEVKPETPSASSALAPEEPAESENEPTPPPVTVSEVPDEPLTEVTPGPSLSGNLSTPKSSTTEGTPPATNTEIAALSPIALPPAANDGSTRYGIEIGIVAKQDGLRPLWREFLTNHAALVAGLQPRRVLAPDKKWRLIAGPFANAAEANQACLLFKKAQKPCEATVFAGDSL